MAEPKRVDVCAERNVPGDLTGMTSFGKHELSDRVPCVKTAICDLEISNTVSMDGYTSNVEEVVKERIYKEYEVYQQHGLTYGKVK